MTGEKALGKPNITFESEGAERQRPRDQAPSNDSCNGA